jgi:hypothetical protein
MLTLIVRDKGRKIEGLIKKPCCLLVASVPDDWTERKHPANMRTKTYEPRTSLGGLREFCRRVDVGKTPLKRPCNAGVIAVPCQFFECERSPRSTADQRMFDEFYELLASRTELLNVLTGAPVLQGQENRLTNAS